MSTSRGMENIVLNKTAAFLANKPLWGWWIFHVVITGVFFGVFYLAFYLLTIQWWVGTLILLATGMIWGSVKYFQRQVKLKAEQKVEQKENKKANQKVNANSNEKSG